MEITQNKGKKKVAKGAKITPMIRQYLDIKNEYPDHILLFRMGDFYEMFFEDAEKASKILDIALTSRSKGNGQAIPLCGVPHHALTGYLAKLIRANQKVAICDQVEDPKLAKGIVKRAVTRVVTPGVVIEANELDEKSNNYLMSIWMADDAYGYCLADLSTGEFRLGQTENLTGLVDEVVRAEPSELLFPQAHEGDDRIKKLSMALPGPFLSYLADDVFSLSSAAESLPRQFADFQLSAEENKRFSPAIQAAGGALHYLHITQKRELLHLKRISLDRTDSYLILDEAAKRNLELTGNLRDQSRKDTLLAVLDHTSTAMGARLLRRWICYPLAKKNAIQERLDAVEECVKLTNDREALIEAMESIHDLERLAGRIGLASCNARDLIALRNSLQRLPDLQQALGAFKNALFIRLAGELDLLPDIQKLLSAAIEDEPPLALRDGRLIKKGYHPEVDELRQVARGGRQVISEIESSERKRTGINNLRIRYNSVFGYYIEVTKSQLNLVPEDYHRKQTLVNAERFITPELKVIEEKILTAQDRIVELEYDLFVQIRQQVADEVQRIQNSARVVAWVDVLTCFARLAEKRGYCKPSIEEDEIIQIHDGRHPVVEMTYTEERFVPNDCLLDTNENRLLLITGPNMAGKSTYIRQVALMVIMAQMGCYIPASKGHIGLVDRVFTRVGAGDNLARGQSTFMVEMTETADILNNATRNSLIILDEVGRGTSTFDGLSIAWAVAEYILSEEKIGARTLFATHYHELTDLARTKNGVANYNIAVKEWNDQVLFLRKIVPGATSRSYGIQVARLAGLPDQVIDRAKEVLTNLEKAEFDEIGRVRLAEQKTENKKDGSGQLSLFHQSVPAPIVEELKALDLSQLTPLEALNALARLQEKLK